MHKEPRNPILMIDSFVALLDIHPVNQGFRTCAIFE
jgi:hypothetical protein